MKASRFARCPSPTASQRPITSQARLVLVGSAADPGRLPALATRSTWVRSPTFAVSACHWRVYVDAIRPHRTGNHRLCYPMRRQVVAVLQAWIARANRYCVTQGGHYYFDFDVGGFHVPTKLLQSRFNTPCSAGYRAFLGVFASCVRFPFGRRVCRSSAAGLGEPSPVRAA